MPVFATQIPPTVMPEGYSFAGANFGMKIPAASSDKAATAQIIKPGMKLPDKSLSAPTNRGDRNAPLPATVIMNPQTKATCWGVIPGISMGSEKMVGTYSQEPTPKTITEK